MRSWYRERLSLGFFVQTPSQMFLCQCIHQIKVISAIHSGGFLPPPNMKGESLHLPGHIEKTGSVAFLRSNNGLVCGGVFLDDYSRSDPEPAVKTHSFSTASMIRGEGCRLRPRDPQLFSISPHWGVWPCVCGPRLTRTAFLQARQIESVMLF